MSEAGANLQLQPAVSAAAVPADVFLGQIFLEFLIVGATSFGGILPYLRGSLVTNRHWIDDKRFVEMLSITRACLA